MIDDIRKAYRHRVKTVSLEDDDGEHPFAQSAAMDALPLRAHDTENRQAALAAEIEEFKDELSQWGITLEALSKHAPKHRKRRQAYQLAVSGIMGRLDIVQTLQLKRYLPVKAIAKISGLPLKKVDRGRTFMIASLIIKLGDYEYLSDYIDDRR